MSRITDVFDNLDRWRHLPNYQIERRADAFFALYLQEVLQKKTGIEIHDTLIPEFPIHLQTLNADIKHNRSVKIDYVAFSRDLSRVWFVELKTDLNSRRGKQDDDLKQAKKIKLPLLLEGLKIIFAATSAKQKYYRLFATLEELGLLQIPEQLHQMMAESSFRDIIPQIERIKIAEADPDIDIIYLQPKREQPDIITFAEFSHLISHHTDELTLRFRKSLSRWATSPAGD